MPLGKKKLRTGKYTLDQPGVHDIQRQLVDDDRSVLVRRDMIIDFAEIHIAQLRDMPGVQLRQALTIPAEHLPEFRFQWVHGRNLFENLYLPVSLENRIEQRGSGTWKPDDEHRIRPTVLHLQGLPAGFIESVHRSRQFIEQTEIGARVHPLRGKRRPGYPVGHVGMAECLVRCIETVAKITQQIRRRLPHVVVCRLPGARLQAGARSFEISLTFQEFRPTQGNRPTVTAAGGADQIDATTDFDVTTFAQDDRIEVDVDQVETGNPQDVTVIIEVQYT